jgi:hypothetical protein
MVDIPEALQHKLGPLEAWQWGALAGGAILVYRVVSSQGHQSTGVGTVTLTPNNQPDVSGSGTDTIGSVLSGFAATGLFPDEFSITLPNGTVVTFKGGRIVSTTPAGSTPPATTPPADPSLGGIASPLFPVPYARGGGVAAWRPGDPVPIPVPYGRGGPVIPGARPGPAPGSGPANVYIPSLPAVPAAGGPGGRGGGGSGVTPGVLPGARGGGATGGTPGVLPGQHGSGGNSGTPTGGTSGGTGGGTGPGGRGGGGTGGGTPTTPGGR